MVIVHGHVSLPEGIRFHWGWFETKAIDFNHFSLPVPLSHPVPTVPLFTSPPAVNRGAIFVLRQ